MWITTAAQMGMGFTLPFALVFVAIPLETFVQSLRTVVGLLGIGGLRLLRSCCGCSAASSCMRARRSCASTTFRSSCRCGSSTGGAKSGRAKRSVVAARAKPRWCHEPRMNTDATPIARGRGGLRRRSCGSVVRAAGAAQHGRLSAARHVGHLSRGARQGEADHQLHAVAARRARFVRGGSHRHGQLQRARHLGQGDARRSAERGQSAEARVRVSRSSGSSTTRRSRPTRTSRAGCCKPSSS